MLDRHNVCTMWQAFTEVSTVTVQTGRCEAFKLRIVHLQAFGLLAALVMTQLQRGFKLCNTYSAAAAGL